MEDLALELRVTSTPELTCWPCLVRQVRGLERVGVFRRALRGAFICPHAEREVE